MHIMNTKNDDQHLRGYTDCMDVHRSSIYPVKALAPSTRTATFWRGAIRHGTIPQATKVKGHQNPSKVQDPEKKVHAKGNGHADLSAKAGAHRHLVPSATQRQHEELAELVMRAARLTANFADKLAQPSPLTRIRSSIYNKH